MSSSQQKDGSGKLEFERKESEYDFQRTLSSVDIVAQKQVILRFDIRISDGGIIVRSAIFVEETHQMAKLTMYRSKYFDSRIQLYHHRLFRHHFYHLFAQC